MKYDTAADLMGGGAENQRQRSVRLAGPNKFTASESNAVKRAMQFRAWANAVRARWNAWNKFTDEASKILWASTVMGGTALGGVLRAVNEMTKPNSNPTKWEWQTAEEFMAYLEKKYNTVDMTAQAEMSLRNLKQEGRYSNFIDFSTQLQTLTDEAGWDPATKVRFLQDRVNAQMRQGLTYQLSRPARDDWAGWLHRCTEPATNIVAEEGSGKYVELKD